MAIADEYRRQAAWRSWPTVFDALPPLRGARVLDLGSAIGDQTAELSARGAHVVGIDLDDELLAVARARDLEHAEFRRLDLAALPDLGFEADGIWSSFAAAYFTDLAPVLESWSRHLRRGGWIALTEIDDLFGHEPLGAATRSLFDGYAADAFSNKRYDFHMGRKLRGHLESAGFTVSKSFVLEDQEFSFTGAARPDVLDAWRERLDRMKLLRSFCGAAFEGLRNEFSSCLARPEHRSRASVQCCIAHRPAEMREHR